VAALNGTQARFPANTMTAGNVRLEAELLSNITQSELSVHSFSPAVLRQRFMKRARE